MRFNSFAGSVAKWLRLPFSISYKSSCINTLQVFVVASPRPQSTFSTPTCSPLKHTLSLHYSPLEPKLFARNQIEINAYTRNRRAIAVAKSLRNAGVTLAVGRALYCSGDEQRLAQFTPISKSKFSIKEVVPKWHEST